MGDEDLSRLKIDKSAVIRGSSGSKKKKIYAVAGASLVVIILALYLSGTLSPAVEVQPVTVSRIYPSQTFTLLDASGYVVAERKAALASKVTGRIIQLNVEEGSRVKKGEIIARLESNDVSAAREQAAANLKAAQANVLSAKASLQDASLAYERNKQLVKSGYIARADYDTSEARYKGAKAAMEAAEQAMKAAVASLKGSEVAIDYTILRAPFDAVVLTKNADVGDIVTPIGATANVQSAVVTVADMNSLIVEVDVSESDIGKVSVGQPCEIQLDALPDKRFRGRVHMVVPTADRSKATVMVKVRFIEKDDRILPEMSAKVAFLSHPVSEDEMKPFTAVNQTAVVTKNGKGVVFLIDGDKARESVIKTGRKMGEMIEILEGVKAGDKVVLNPPEKLRDGSKIKISEK